VSIRQPQLAGAVHVRRGNLGADEAYPQYLISERRSNLHKTARHKLNSAHFLGCLLIAGVVGGITDSWTVFLIAAIVLVALSINSGDIRLAGRK
jgi:hypothetical protein